MVAGVGPNFPYDPITNPTGYQPGQKPIGAAIAVNPYAKNPYLDVAEKEKGKAEFLAGQQPQISEGIRNVMAGVNRFQTGRLGAALTREVYAPATQAASAYDIEQTRLGKEITLKGQEWEAGEAERRLENLRKLAESPNATQEDIDRYRAALKGEEYTAPAPAVPGAPAAPVKLPKAAIQAQIDALKNIVGKGNAAADKQYNDLMNEMLGTTGQNYIAPSTPATDPAAQKVITGAKSAIDSIADQFSISTPTGGGDWVRQAIQQGLSNLKNKINGFVNILSNPNVSAEEQSAAVAGLQDLLNKIKDENYIYTTYIKPVDSRLGSMPSELKGDWLA